MRKNQPKPKWTFRPEPWLESLVEKEIRINPLLEGSKTAAIHALVKRTLELEAKLKEAKADTEAWKSRAEFLEAFMKKHGIPTPKAEMFQ